MKLHNNLTVVFYFIGIASMLYTISGIIGFAWWCAIVIDLIWVYWVTTKADKKVIYEKTGIKYLVENVFELN